MQYTVQHPRHSAGLPFKINAMNAGCLITKSEQFVCQDSRILVKISPEVQRVLAVFLCISSKSSLSVVFFLSVVFLFS